MPISTTDVITNVVSGRETIQNGSAVVYCWFGRPISGSGNYQALISPFEYEKSYSYTANASRLTNRFDNVTYYTTGASGILGV
jgi:hypothetical protein